MTHDEDLAPAHTPTADGDRPALVADWEKALGGKEKAKAAVEQARPRVEKLADPFGPIARNEQGARDGEHVVFEDDDFMVLVDKFGAGLKMLVIPKREALFLTDLSPDEQVALERLTGQVAAVLTREAKPPRDVQCWVNPPRGLSVKQLHVHVQPHCNPSPIEEARVLEAIGRELFGPQEVELKFGLKDKAAADKVRKLFGLTEMVQQVQVNAFYDTPNFFLLNQAFMVCRVRSEGDKRTLTMKGRSSGEGTLTQKREEEWLLDNDAVAAFEADTFDPLAYADAHPLDGGAEAVLPADIRKVLEGAALVNVGEFENRRTKKDVTLTDDLGEISVTLEMDATVFPGGAHAHELEIEVPDATIGERVDDIVQAMFEQAGIEMKPTSSKAKRFFAALAAQKK